MSSAVSQRFWNKNVLKPAWHTCTDLNWAGLFFHLSTWKITWAKNVLRVRNLAAEWSKLSLKYRIEAKRPLQPLIFLVGENLRLNSCYTETNPQLTCRFSAEGAKTDFSSVHRLAVEPELNAVFYFFCPPGDRNIPKNAFQYAFFLSNRTIKKGKQENKREKKSRLIKTALIPGWSPIYCFQPSPTGFNLSGTLSFARGCETRICIVVA